jgi:hypothetical protein
MPKGFRSRAVVLALSAMPAACVRTGLTGLPPGGPFAGGAPASLNVGGRSVVVAECRSGDHELFLGVDLLAAEGGLRLRVAIDPIDGPRLKLFREGRAELVDPVRCQDLKAVVRPTRWRVNEVRDVQGEVTARCTLADGSVFEAQVAFAHCH